MSQQQWSAVDAYLCDSLIPQDAVLSDALRDSDQAGLPQINVAPNLGKFLHLLAQIQGARRILEVGTLGGYSTIWLARALPKDGQLITLEYSPEHAAVAKANIARAGLSERVDIRVGLAVDSLAKIAQEGLDPFDFIFIDADKPSNPYYLEWSLKLARIGTIIVVDNVVRDGEVVDAHTSDEKIQGARAGVAFVANHPRLSATAIQTVGSKGYDGFLLATVVA